ncbi:MAG: InlB B-repeat-containing protein, partial [Thomasclavelia spiroformis]
YNGSGVVYKPGGLPYYPDSVYPVLHLNLANEKAYTYAGTVCTNGTVNEQNKPNSGTVEDNSKYEITFDKNANNAVVDFSSKVVTKGDKYGKLPEARRNNYVFAGWYTKKKGGTKVTSDTVVKISKNQRLYAQWRLGGYIIYDLNEGTNAKANPSYYYSTNGVKLEAPKRKGYIFKGWYTTKDFSTGTKISKIKVGTRGDKVLYARWGAKKNQEIQIEKQITKTYKDIGKEFKLSISGRQENAKVTYASSNKKVATAKDGKILIKGVGKATITVNFAETTNYNAAKKKMEVIVLDEQTIQINARFETGTGFPALAIGIMNEIHYTSEKILLNATAEGNKLSYTSSDKKIAVVDKNGGIQCKSTGIVTITITAKQTEKYAKATQRVTFKIAKGKPVINCPKEINKNVFDAPFNLGANTGAEKVTLSYESNAPEATVDK